MAAATSYCPNCGKPVQPQAIFCANCGTKLSAPPMAQSQPPPSFYSPTLPQQPPVSTGPYKAIIAILLIIIVILGVLYATGGAHLPFSLGGYRYQLATPPNYQSTVPAPTFTSQTPEHVIWNACGNGPACTMSSSGWREGSVPDAYNYFVSFMSTVNVTVYFFTMGQFVQFSVCNGDISCVSGYYDSIPATTNLPKYTQFTLGEGCADYLAIYVASDSGVMYPNVAVSWSPASTSTGYCAQAGT